MEGRGAGVRPGVVVRAIIRGIHDDGVIREAEVVDLLEEFADQGVVFDHAVGVFVIARMAVLLPHVGAKVHARRVPPAEKGLLGRGLALDEVLCRVIGFIVDRLHALLCQWSKIFDDLTAFAIGLGLDHATWPEDFAKCLAVGQDHVAGIVLVLRLFLGVEVIKAAEELIESVHGWQVFVAISLVVFSELPRSVALAFQDRGHGAVGLLPAFGGAGHSHLGHATANRHRAADECGATGRTALLRVVVGEAHAFLGDAVNVRRLVAHHAAVIVANVPGTNIVTPDDEDVRLLLLR